jgi:hypothetical protein
VDVVQLREHLSAQLGHDVSAYNFGAGGVSVPALPLAIELAWGVDAPSLALVVVSARMASAWSPQPAERLRLFRESAYGRALDDPLPWRRSVRRFLLDRVAVFGLRYRLAALLLGRPSARRSAGGYDPRRGFQSWPAQGPEARERQLRLDAESDWTVDATKIAELVEVVRRLEAHGARVWLVEAPVAPERTSAWRRDGVDPDLPATILRVAEETRARALLLPDELELAPEAFNGLVHLTARGAERYTEWLGALLAADLLQDGVPPRDAARR